MPTTPHPCCDTSKRRIDYLLLVSSAVMLLAVGSHYFFAPLPLWSVFAEAVVDLLSVMWWGIVLAILLVGILGQVPREFVSSLLGRAGSKTGVLRATLAGLLFDLCSHGILIVGMRLYERGASLGQVMAFLIASPWNSLSLTMILVALIGWQWTLLFVVLSAVVAVISGWIFDGLVAKNVLPANPHRCDLPEDFRFFKEIRARAHQIHIGPKFWREVLRDGLSQSRMVLRWVFFGVVLAALIRSFLSAEHFSFLFGATAFGVLMTLLAATVIEVCSEGSVPIAADILTRAKAPGNAFTFLMTGVATDYTEVMSLKERTKSWKIALFLPLVTVPQVLVLGIIINGFTSFG